MILPAFLFFDKGNFHEFLNHSIKGKYPTTMNMFTHV
jgi:hypothetical protein